MATVTVISPVTGKPVEHKRVAAYCRVSTNSADQQNSYNTQVRYYTRYIKSRTEYVYHTQYRFLPVVVLDPVSPRSYSPGRTQSPRVSLAFLFFLLRTDFSAHYRNRLRSFYDILHTDVLMQRCKLP